MFFPPLLKSPHSLSYLIFRCHKEDFCRNPTLKECEDDIHTLKMWTWESSGTPEYLELDCRGQNTSPWNNLYTVGKVSKCRCRRPWMSHLDICSTSYGWKKGINPTLVRVGGVRHTIGKVLKRGKNLLQTSSQSKVCARNYEFTKSREFKSEQFRDSSLGVPR
jgi:hypothetical protein